MSAGWAYQCDYCGNLDLKEADPGIRPMVDNPPAGWCIVMWFYGAGKVGRKTFCSDTCAMGEHGARALEKETA